MEKDRSAKVLAILALFIAVIGLSLGFAAFSANLVIKPAAQVEPKNDFKVLFSSDSESLLTAPIEPSGSHSGEATEDPTGDNATIDNTQETNPTLKGLNAKFTEPGQTVTYEVYAFNQSSYDAFLRSVTIAGGKTCTGASDLTNKEPGTDAMVQAACAHIKLSVQVGSDLEATEVTKNDYQNHKLAKNTGEKITVTITYEEADDALVDGDFKVTFGDITLNYSTADKKAS